MRGWILNHSTRAACLTMPRGDHHRIRITPAGGMLRAWSTAAAAGHSLTPGEFLVLCDIVETRQQLMSIRTRARRLRVSHPLVCQAQQKFQALGLVTLTELPWPCPHLKRSYTSYAATPTHSALRLFGKRRLRSPIA